VTMAPANKKSTDNVLKCRAKHVTRKLIIMCVCVHTHACLRVLSKNITASATTIKKSSTGRV